MKTTAGTNLSSKWSLDLWVALLCLSSLSMQSQETTLQFTIGNKWDLNEKGSAFNLINTEIADHNVVWSLVELPFPCSVTAVCFSLDKILMIRRQVL